MSDGDVRVSLQGSDQQSDFRFHQARPDGANETEKRKSLHSFRFYFSFAPHVLLFRVLTSQHAAPLSQTSLAAERNALKRERQNNVNVLSPSCTDWDHK